MSAKTLFHEVYGQDKAIAITEKYAEVNGKQTHYRIGGKGPPLMLLHGFTLTGKQWDPFINDLMEHYTVIIPDLPGHGGSEFQEDTFSYEGTAKAMIGLLRQLNIQSIKAIGHSAGSITLMFMAVEDPNILESMILISGGHYSCEQGRKLLVEEKFEDLNTDLQEFYYSIHPGGIKQLQGIFKAENEMAAQFTTSSDQAALSPEILDTIKTPAFLIWGDRDIYFPIDVATDLYQSLPNARLWVLPGQDHVPLWPEWGGDINAAKRFVPVAHHFFSNPYGIGGNALTN